MTDANNAPYYAARAQAARKLAEDADSRGIKQIHKQMADEYEKLATEGDPRPLRVVTAS